MFAPHTCIWFPCCLFHEQSEHTSRCTPCADSAVDCYNARDRLFFAFHPSAGAAALAARCLFRLNHHFGFDLQDQMTMARFLSLGLVISIPLMRACSGATENTTAIEILVATVRPGDMARYLPLDDEIWTSFLRTQDGFITKRNLLPTRQPLSSATEAYHFIEWASFTQWKNVPADALAATNERFVRAFGYAPKVKALPDFDGLRLVESTDA